MSDNPGLGFLNTIFIELMVQKQVLYKPRIGKGISKKRYSDWTACKLNNIMKTDLVYIKDPYKFNNGKPYV